MRTGIVALFVLMAAAGAATACSSGSSLPDGACPGSDPSCNDASSSPSPDASPAEAAADTSETITDASADTSDGHCIFTVDDAGVTHGCGGGGTGMGDHDDGGGAPSPPPPDAALDASDLPLGAPCWNNAQCESMICFDYAVRGTFCTQLCLTSAECPPPANGCNGMGVCRFGDGGM
ncbi:MAG TPA: hypothetical protein VHS09_02800 [Polyangiaceae bacterium]|nr:hypothetical protein [Polyangiaceae bacterium]